MKTVVLIVLALLALSVPAATVTFEWDPNDPEEKVAGYQLWERMPDGSSRKVAQAVSPAATASADFGPGSHTVYLTAFSASGVHSEPSNDLTFLVPKKPGAPRIRIAIQASSNLTDWLTIAVQEVPAGEERQFYRIAFQP